MVTRRKSPWEPKRCCRGRNSLLTLNHASGISPSLYDAVVWGASKRLENLLKDNKSRGMQEDDRQNLEQIQAWACGLAKIFA